MEYMEKVLSDILYELKEIRSLLEGSSNKSTGDEVVSIVLTDPGKNKIKVIQAVREITDFGLKEAKDMVDYLPSTIISNISKKCASIYAYQLEALGAKVEIR